jgi:hypothetical protein
MSAPNVKSWKMERGAYLSPPLPDMKTYGSVKKFLIRAGIQAEFDVTNKIIRIPINGPNGKKNLETLVKLRLIDREGE